MSLSIKGTSVGFLNKGWETVSNFPSSLKGLTVYTRESLRSRMGSAKDWILSLPNKIFETSTVSLDNPWADGLPELETCKNRIIELRKPFEPSIDSIASFVRPLIPDGLNEVLIATNCEDPKEAQVIFLGEQHENQACLELQKNVLSSLGRPGDEVFQELNEEDFFFSEELKESSLTKVISESGNSYKLRGWDSVLFLKKIEYSKRLESTLREPCDLLKEVLGHLKKGNREFVNQDFMKKIREDYSGSKFRFLKEEEKQALKEEWDPKIDEARKSNNLIKELACYFDQLSSACDIYYSRNFSWDKRQESLVSHFPRKSKLGRQFYIAGRNHFFDFENKKLESAFANGIEQDRVKHITIIPQLPIEECLKDVNDKEDAGLNAYQLVGLFDKLLKELKDYLI